MPNPLKAAAVRRTKVKVRIKASRNKAARPNNRAVPPSHKASDPVRAKDNHPVKASNRARDRGNPAAGLDSQAHRKAAALNKDRDKAPGNPAAGPDSQAHRRVAAPSKDRDKAPGNPATGLDNQAHRKAAALNKDPGRVRDRGSVHPPDPAVHKCRLEEAVPQAEDLDLRRSAVALDPADPRRPEAHPDREWCNPRRHPTDREFQSALISGREDLPPPRRRAGRVRDSIYLLPMARRIQVRVLHRDGVPLRHATRAVQGVPLGTADRIHRPQAHRRARDARSALTPAEAGGDNAASAVVISTGDFHFVTPFGNTEGRFCARRPQPALSNGLSGQLARWLICAKL